MRRTVRLGPHPCQSQEPLGPKDPNLEEGGDSANGDDDDHDADDDFGEDVGGRCFVYGS